MRQRERETERQRDRETETDKDTKHRHRYRQYVCTCLPRGSNTLLGGARTNHEIIIFDICVCAHVRRQARKPTMRPSCLMSPYHPTAPAASAQVCVRVHMCVRVRACACLGMRECVQVPKTAAEEGRNLCACARTYTQSHSFTHTNMHTQVYSHIQTVCWDILFHALMPSSFTGFHANAQAMHTLSRAHRRADTWLRLRHSC